MLLKLIYIYIIKSWGGHVTPLVSAPGDRSAKLYLSQDEYIKKVLERFSMDKVKVINYLLAIHFKLSIEQCPSTDKEKEDMKRVPYA